GLVGPANYPDQPTSCKRWASGPLPLRRQRRLTMSDHVDGPRSIGEPAADLTDLFAFTSPENPARTVLAACVFPSAGEDAMFSNVIDYSIVVPRVTGAGLGN